MEKLIKELICFAVIFAALFWPLMLKNFAGLIIMVIWWILLLVIGTYIDKNSRVKAKVKGMFQSYKD